jgi:hypothetical protein
MNLGAILSEQTELAAWIDKHFAREFPVDRQTHLALACFDLAIEHHAAICVLGNASLYGSLYALIRVQFEAYGRGLWLLHVASAEQVAAYEQDKMPVTFGELLTLVEKQIGAVSAPLSVLKTKHWDMFCSFAHTGFQAIVRRVGDGQTGVDNYKQEEVASAVRLAGSFALLAASALAAISRDSPLIQATLAKAREYAR